MNKSGIVYNNFVKTEFAEAINVRTSATNGASQPYLHWHPHYEIQIIFGGFYTVENNNTVLSSEKPGVFIHSPYSLHTTNAPAGQIYHRCVISVNRRIPAMFDSSILDMSLFEGVNFIYAYPNHYEMLEFQNIASQIQNNAANRSLGALYVALLINMASIIVKDGRGSLISRSVTYIQDALQYVSDNIAEPKTVETLAARYKVGKTKFNLDFKNATGSTYKKYITDLRQTRARELLDGGASIIKASLEVGYSSEAHFIKAFKEYWGTTPGEYMRGLMQL